jgi:DNA-binding transcriptional ArsR family regulator
VSDDRCDLLCIDFDHAERLRAGLPAPAAMTSVADRFRALGDPTRLRIAHALLDGDELCVCDLGWVVGVSQGLVSHHLRQLRATGLAESRRDKKMVMYRLTATGRAALAAITAPAAADEPAAVRTAAVETDAVEIDAETVASS